MSESGRRRVRDGTAVLILTPPLRLVIATGNYNFFNLLTAALCIPVASDDFDDQPWALEDDEVAAGERGAVAATGGGSGGGGGKGDDEGKGGSETTTRNRRTLAGTLESDGPLVTLALLLHRAHSSRVFCRALFGVGMAYIVWCVQHMFAWEDSSSTLPPFSLTFGTAATEAMVIAVLPSTVGYGE